MLKIKSGSEPPSEWQLSRYAISVSGKQLAIAPSLVALTSARSREVLEGGSSSSLVAPVSDTVMPQLCKSRCLGAEHLRAEN